MPSKGRGLTDQEWVADHTKNKAAAFRGSNRKWSVVLGARALSVGCHDSETAWKMARERLEKEHQLNCIG